MYNYSFLSFVVKNELGSSTSYHPYFAFTFWRDPSLRSSFYFLMGTKIPFYHPYTCINELGSVLWQPKSVVYPMRVQLSSLIIQYSDHDNGQMTKIGPYMALWKTKFGIFFVNVLQFSRQYMACWQILGFLHPLALLCYPRSKCTIKRYSRLKSPMEFISRCSQATSILRWWRLHTGELGLEITSVR